MIKYWFKRHWTMHRLRMLYGHAVCPQCKGSATKPDDCFVCLSRRAVNKHDPVLDVFAKRYILARKKAV